MNYKILKVLCFFGWHTDWFSEQHSDLKFYKHCRICGYVGVRH